MNVYSKMNKNKVFVFVIQTVNPFCIPLIWEIKKEYIAKSIQWVMVIGLSVVDLFLIYELNKHQEEDDEKHFKNKIARDAYSNVYELNERKRDYIVTQSYVEGIMVISTYGKKFVEDNDNVKINQLQRLIIDDLLPNYQRMLETEMGVLYLRHLKV